MAEGEGKCGNKNTNCGHKQEMDGINAQALQAASYSVDPWPR